MVQKGMRGLTIVRPVRYNKGTKFERVVREEFNISCNAAIPFSHKEFQSQHLEYRPEPKPQAKKNNKPKVKFDKNRKYYGKPATV